jgi:hypothetical protein
MIIFCTGNCLSELARISHEPERCRNKAFQPEDIVILFRGLNNVVAVPLWLAFGEEFIYKIQINSS